MVALASQTDSVPLQFKLLAAVPLQERIAGSPSEQEVVTAFVDPTGTLTDLASNVLLRCELSKVEAKRLADSLPSVAPQHLMTAIEAIHRSHHREIEAAMLDDLRSLPAARTLPRGFLTNLYKPAEQALRKQAALTTSELESPPRRHQASGGKDVEPTE